IIDRHRVRPDQPRRHVTLPDPPLRAEDEPTRTDPTRPSHPPRRSEAKPHWCRVILVALLRVVVDQLLDARPTAVPRTTPVLSYRRCRQAAAARQTVT